MLIKTVGAINQLAAARRDSSIVAGSAYYACVAQLSDPAAIDVEKMLAEGIAGDGGTLEDLLQVNVYANYNTVFTAQALRSGDYHNVLNAQGRNNLWLVSSILAHENWRDLSDLGYQVAEQIALAEASSPFRPPSFHSLTAGGDQALNPAE